MRWYAKPQAKKASLELQHRANRIGSQMGSKSQVRSMQRGAAKRDPSAPDTSPDYGKVKPKLRKEDLAHLGLTEERFVAFAKRLAPKIRAYAAGGFRKPAQVCKLLNREEIKTLAGSDWSPRLVYFLLSKVFSMPAERGAKAVNTAVVSSTTLATETRSPAHAVKVSLPRPYSPGGVPLTENELQKRLDALRAHFNR